MRMLHINLLGDFSLTDGQAPVAAISSARLQSLIAFLFLNRKAPKSRQQLSFLFWPDSAESQARTNLRKLLYDLRKAFPDVDQYIDMEGSNIQLIETAQFLLDVDEFEKRVSQAQYASELKNALALYRGDLLPSCYDDWILIERQRLHQLFIDGLERLITMLEEKREYRSAILYTQRLLQHAPLQEDYYRLLMRLYALNGDRAGVLRTFHACATTLQRELEVEPSQLTREAYERLLNLDSPLSQLPPTTPRLVGRNAEWAQIQAGWRNAMGGHPIWVMLTGEEGVGKTRLAEELVQWAARQGVATASTQCYAPDSLLTLVPVVKLLRARPLPPLNKLWLSEISRLLPEILVDHPNLDPPGELKEAWQRHRFFEALSKAILATQPILLFVDNLQWCDRDTVEWLNYLIRYDSSARLLLLTTLRSESLSAGHPLSSILPALRRLDQLVEIDLPPLNESETTLLAQNASSDGLEPGSYSGLYNETKGNPLYTLEMLRSGLSSDGQSKNDHLPLSMQKAIQSRLKNLSPTANDLADLAATVGRAFTFDILSHASNAEEDELVRGLDELWQQQIVREQASDAYEFSHQKLGEVAYAGMDAARRSMLHKKVAEALEANVVDDLDIVSGEIAAHFEEAGLLDRALPYYIRAGDVARRMYANDSAIRYYRQSLSLLPESEQMDVMLKLGEVLQLVGNWTEAEALFRQALRLTENYEDPKAHAYSEAALGEVLHLKGSYAEALSWLERARDDFKSLGDQHGVCKALESMGDVYFWQLDYGLALECHEQQLEAAKQMRDKAEVGKANGSIGMIYWQQGKNDRAMECFEGQLNVGNGMKDLPNICQALLRIGLVHWVKGANTQGLIFFERGLQIAREIGDRQAIGYAVGYIGNIYYSRGDLHRAFEYYAQKLEIAHGLGDRRATSHAFRNLGVVYLQRGEFERALSCFAHSLQIAIAIGTRRTIARTLGNIAVVRLYQGETNQAGYLFQQVTQLVSEATLPYHLCESLYYFAELNCTLGQYEEAERRNNEAFGIAKRIERKDILFKAQLMSYHIRSSIKSMDSSEAIDAFKELLETWTKYPEQAEIYYQLWLLDLDKESGFYGQKAAGLFRGLYEQTSIHHYAQRYYQLTGERLSTPDPLPELPGIAPQDPVQFNILLERISRMILDETTESMQKV
jgi:DNA-binding SARP family transcriptional activator/Tfp pilus assembly protein PilF